MERHTSVHDAPDMRNSSVDEGLLSSSCNKAGGATDTLFKLAHCFMAAPLQSAGYTRDAVSHYSS